MGYIPFPEMVHDDCMVSLFRFEDGAIAKVAALYGSRREMAPYYNLRVHGTRGTVERDQVAVCRDEAEAHGAPRAEFPRLRGRRPGGLLSGRDREERRRAICVFC